MKANVPNDFEIAKQTREKGYKKILERAKNRLPVKGHGYFVYECPKCGGIYKMHLENGVCQVDPKIFSILEEAEHLKNRAKALTGVDIRMAGLPSMDEGFISVPESFTCPECEKLAEKEADLAYAHHIFQGCKYEDNKEYDIVNGMNHFALSVTLGQGIPIVFGTDYENRQAFLINEAKNFDIEQKEIMNDETSKTENRQPTE